MSDISTNMPSQRSTFGMVVGNTSRETLSTLTLASTTHAKYRREIKVKCCCKRNGSITELHITSHLLDCNDFTIAGSQDMEETQDEEEVVQEDLIVLQSNLLMSPPGKSHFATEATLEEDGYDSDNKINPMNTLINEDSMEEDNAALPEVSDELAASGEQDTQEYGGNFVDIPEDSLK